MFRFNLCRFLSLFLHEINALISFRFLCCNIPDPPQYLGVCNGWLDAMTMLGNIPAHDFFRGDVSVDALTGADTALAELPSPSCACLGDSTTMVGTFVSPSTGFVFASFSLMRGICEVGANSFVLCTFENAETCSCKQEIMPSHSTSLQLLSQNSCNSRTSLLRLCRRWSYKCRKSDAGFGVAFKGYKRVNISKRGVRARGTGIRYLLRSLTRRGELVFGRRVV